MVMGNLIMILTSHQMMQIVTKNKLMKGNKNNG